MADHDATLTKAFGKGNTFALWLAMRKILQTYPDVTLPREIQSEICSKDLVIKQDNLAMFVHKFPPDYVMDKSQMHQILYTAVRAGSENITTHLLDRGANILGIDNFGRKAPYLAVKSGSPAFFDYIAMLYADAAEMTILEVLCAVVCGYGTAEHYARTLGFDELSAHICEVRKSFEE